MPTKATKNIKITNKDGRHRIAVIPGRKTSVSAKIAATKRKPRFATVAKASTVTASSTRRPLPPLYRDKKTGKTWSGRGRQPLWIKGDRERYAI